MAYKRISPQPVVEGGTGASTLTAHSLLLGEGTSAISPLGAATNGQIPIGSTGADPVLAAISAGTGISVTNGAGSITLATSSGLLTASPTLTSSQVKNLHGTPIQAIAAAGAGTVLWPIAVIGKLNYGGSNVFVAGAAQFIALMYAPVGNNNRPFNVLLNAQLVASSNQYNINTTYTITGAAATQYENTDLVFYNTSATEISGNAAGNNTVTFQILYKVVTI